jgi:hypothetical protein
MVMQTIPPAEPIVDKPVTLDRDVIKIMEIKIA